MHTHNFTLSGHCPTLYTVYTHSQRLQQHAVRILLNGKSNINPSITFRNWKRAKSTYHFIIDFVKMNFTDFLYNVFMLERYEAEACGKRDRNRGRVSRVPFELKLRQVSASIRGESVGSSDLNGHCLFESQALMKSLTIGQTRGKSDSRKAQRLLMRFIEPHLNFIKCVLRCLHWNFTV